jgi:NTE family protein
MQRPDILVLGAGGTIGAAWMSGLLAALVEKAALDLGAVEHFVGTSAGAMVAADLLAGAEPRAPQPGEAPVAVEAGALAAEGLAVGEGQAAVDEHTPSGNRDAAEGDEPRVGSERGGEPGEPGDGSGGFARAAAASAARFGGLLAERAGRPLAPLALAAARPGGALVRARALARIAAPDAALDDLRERIAGHGLRFDGRLRVVCVERESGRRVIFGAPGAPGANVAEAVQASCSVPWVHRPVRIGDHEYVDGAIWSPTNMDAAPALRDTRVLCLSPTGGPLGGRERHPAIRAAASTSATLEVLALQRRGAKVRLITPPPAPPDEHVRLTGYRQGLALARER